MCVSACVRETDGEGDLVCDCVSSGGAEGAPVRSRLKVTWVYILSTESSLLSGEIS